MRDIDQIIDNGLIEAAELAALLQSPQAGSIRILDASYALPGADHVPRHVFEKLRLPGARFFDIEDISDHNASLPHMLPPAAQFAAAAGALGIGNDDLVVIYGQDSIALGPARAWWMFRAFGHARVCVLNGGLAAWRAGGHRLDTSLPSSDAPAAHSVFTARFQPDLVADRAAVSRALERQSEHCVPVFDARPAARFHGIAPEPRPGLRGGHMPGSFNLPAADLIDAKTGRMQPKSDFESLLKRTGATFGPAPGIATCGSGITACAIALAFHGIGQKNMRVYDGSWAEWGQTGLNMPVQTG